MSFKDILGNEKNKILLKNILESGNISHSYLFIGAESIGKMLFAKEFAKGILCNNKQQDNIPCNKCISCIKFENNNHPDFYILNEEEETIKNEQVKVITKKILEKPIEGTKKVYIINNSENMTVQAQNSLLKTLEEPPEHSVIILITKNENMILNTIKSRCIKVHFNPLDEASLNKILKEKYGIESLTNKMLSLAGGSIEKAIKVQKNEEIYSQVEKIFTNLEKIDIIELLKQKEKIFKEKDEINSILEYINVIFYELSKEDKRYLTCISKVEQAKERLKKNANYDMTIDNLLLTVWEEKVKKY